MLNIWVCAQTQKPMPEGSALVPTGSIAASRQLSAGQTICASKMDFGKIKHPNIVQFFEAVGCWLSAASSPRSSWMEATCGNTCPGAQVLFMASGLFAITSVVHKKQARGMVIVLQFISWQ